MPPRIAGGLGRGLAGILDRPGIGVGRASRPGLHQLLGADVSATPPRVRQFVTETALTVLAERFDAEAVAIVRRDEAGQPVVASHLPPSWDDTSSSTFELYGQLWSLLDGRGALLGSKDKVNGHRSMATMGAHQQIEIGGLPTWLGWQGSGNGELVAAVVRRKSFSAVERETLGRLVRSVAVAIGTARSGLALARSLSASVTGEDQHWRAEAVIDLEGKRRRAFAQGESVELAVARAAAKLCRAAVEVAFAGKAVVDGAGVTLVVVLDDQQAPFLGLAITDPDDLSGSVEAVLSAVDVLGVPGRDRVAGYGQSSPQERQTG